MLLLWGIEQVSPSKFTKIIKPRIFLHTRPYIVKTSLQVTTI